MVKSSVIVATVFCITANMATAKPPTPDYSSLEQDGMAQAETKQNGVRELFNGQRQLVVKLLQRPLSIPGGDVAQKATGGTAAHVQIVAIDKATGEVVDNFGVTGSFDGKGQSKVFSETNLDKYNMEKPCGIYEMSMKDYYAARTRSIAQITGGAVYEPYNGVGLMNHAVEGFVGGFVDGDSKGATAGNPIINGVAGAIEGVADATRIYDESQRHDFGVHSDDEKKMSFPIINCHAGGDIFVKNLEGLPSVVEITRYVQPGENTGLADEGTIELLRGNETSGEESQQPCRRIDTSKAESLLEKRISFLESLLATGERVTAEQCSQYNSYSSAGVSELTRLVKEIDAFPISDDEKAAIAKESFSKMEPLSKKVVELEGKAEAEKLGCFRAGNEPPPKDASTCQCASPSLSYTKYSDSIPVAVQCAKCKRVVGVLFHGKLTSANPAVNGKILK